MVNIGKKLAVSSVQGPAASLVSANSTIHEDETDIALSQLKELEVAIETRKVTRVDGRKTRWIDYRRENKKPDPKKVKKKKSKPNPNNKGKLLTKKTAFKVKKTVKKLGKLLPHKVISPAKGKANKPTVNGEDIKNKLEDTEEKPIITNNNNIDNNNKNKNKLENNMKVDVSGPVITSIGTNNVLETMKQQFMQGTIDVPDHTSNGVKEKVNRKITKPTNGTTSPNHLNNEVLKRKPGRPKKVDNAKAPIKVPNASLSPKSEPPTSPTLPPPPPPPPPPALGIPSLKTSTENLSTLNKKVDGNPMSQSITDFYSRRNFLTKGLREVRKSESGSESGNSSPIKDGSPSSLSPSPQLTLSPVSPLAPLVSESSNSNSSFKCPLIAAAAKALSTGTKKPKVTYLTTKKKKILKKSKKENINLSQATNQNTIQNGTAKKNINSGKIDGKAGSIALKKKGRGRKPKGKVGETPINWTKKTSTVIVDVHNTMNGEPQTVIPVQNPIVLRKKKASPPKVVKLPITEPPSETEEKPVLKDTLLDSPQLNSNKEKDLVPPVPEVPNTSPLISRSSSPSLISRKLSNSQSASKVSQSSESGINDSTKTKNDSNENDVLKIKTVPETLNPLNNSSLEVVNNVPDKLEAVESKTVLSQNGTNDQSSQVDLVLKPADISKESIASQTPSQKTLDKNPKVKEIKQVNIKKPAVVSSGEALKRPNSLEKRQKTIQDYMKASSPKEEVPVSISQLPNGIEKLEPVLVNDSAIVATTNNIKLKECDVKSTSVLTPNTAPSSNTSDSNSEPKATVPITPKVPLLTKSSKKTPEKVKNKTLNAVLEKLGSPASKKSPSLDKKVESDSQNSSLPSKQNETPIPKVIKDNSTNYPVTTNTPVNTVNTVASSNTIIEKESLKQSKPILNQDPPPTEKKVVKAPPPTEKKVVKAPPPNPTSIPDKSSTLPAAAAPSAPSAKPKEKVPRFLKQLFQDEGVQNMLRSVNEETSPNADGISASDSGPHKLRPKRANENFISDSPEPDDSLFMQSSKRKKRGTEVDNLYVDEGALNLLTSLESGSRRPSLVDETSSDASPSGKGMTESQATDAPRKRKLSESGSTSTQIVVGKVLQPLEKDIKKTKLDSLPNEYNLTEKAIPEKPNVESSYFKSQTEKQKKKVGRPSLPVPLKQKTKAQLIFQLRKQLNSLGISSENLNISQMKELLAKTKGLTKNGNGKSVPPIKIKLSAGQENGTKSVIGSGQRLEQQSSSMDSNLNTTSNNSEKVQLPPARVAKPAAPNVSPAVDPVKNLSASDKGKKTYNGPLSKQPVKYSTHQVNPQRKVSFASNSSHQQPPHHHLHLTSLVRLSESSSSQRGRMRGPGEGIRQSQRSSVRQSEGSYHYRDISLRKFNNFMQIILNPSTTKMKNSFNSRVLHELCEALSALRRDESVRMVLLSATGSTFCQGIDLTSLQHMNQETKKRNAENLARGIKDFLRALVQFPKVIVAGVNGNAMGLGVTMLPLFDMVYATDKAEFFLPYAKLGQVPEGGATYTFPNYYGKLQSNKLFLGQKMTATQAQQIGLVSESIWHSTFNQELLPKVALLASQSTQSMEGTKALMNHHIITKLEMSVESECRLLLQQWTSPNFSHLSKRFLDASDVQMQKPVNLPL